MKYLKFIKTILLHKWYVLIAGLYLKVSLWRILTHDLTKFTGDEFFGYANKYSGTKDKEFESAWQHHYATNDHHWEHFVHNGKTVPMPLECVREMVADWFAAGKAYNGKWHDPCNFTWYKENWFNMLLHPVTVLRLYKVLTEAEKFKWV